MTLRIAIGDHANISERTKDKMTKFLYKTKTVSQLTILRSKWMPQLMNIRAYLTKYWQKLVFLATRTTNKL